MDEDSTCDSQNFLRSMFIKKSSQYEIKSMKSYNIAEELCTEALKIFKLLDDEEERSSLQGYFESRLLELFSKDHQTYSQNLQKTLKVLEEYITYIFKNINGDIVQNISEYNFLLNIMRNTLISEERQIVFNIIEIFLEKGQYNELYKQCEGILETYNYSHTVDYGVEQHSAICNLVVLLIMSSLDNKKTEGSEYKGLLSVFFKL